MCVCVCVFAADVREHTRALVVAAAPLSATQTRLKLNQSRCRARKIDQVAPARLGSGESFAAAFAVSANFVSDFFASQLGGAPYPLDLATTTTTTTIGGGGFPRGAGARSRNNGRIVQQPVLCEWPARVRVDNEAARQAQTRT